MKLTTKVKEVVLKVVGVGLEMKAGLAAGNQNTPGDGGEAQHWRPNRERKKKRGGAVPVTSFLEGVGV